MVFLLLFALPIGLLSLALAVLCLRRKRYLQASIFLGLGFGLMGVFLVAAGLSWRLL